MSVERPCSVLVLDVRTETKVEDLRKSLEKGDVHAKIDALKKIVIATANGEKLPQLIMTIIRFVMPEPNHTIKKLLLLYWECMEKVFFFLLPFLFENSKINNSHLNDRSTLKLGN